MLKIRSMTFVHAPMERCFRLALSIDLHREATQDVQIGGRNTGLLGPGDTVGWRHTGLAWRLERQSLVEIWRPYTFFREVMVAGTFGLFEHEHHFAPMNDGTRIRDEIRFSAPAGILGQLAERLFLRRRMVAQLGRRNAILKRVAESNQWHQYLDGQPELDTRIYQASMPESSQERRAFAD